MHMEIEWRADAAQRFVQQPLPPRWQRSCHTSPPVLPPSEPADAPPPRFGLIARSGLVKMYGELAVETRAARKRKAEEARVAGVGVVK